MAKKIFDFFLSSYKNDPMEIQKKSQALLLGNITIGVACLFSAVLQYLTNPNPFAIGIFLFAFLVLMITIYILRFHMYLIATYIDTIVTVLVVSSLGYFLKSPSVSQIYQVVGMGLMAYTYIFLISNSHKQLLIYGISFVLSLIVIFIINLSSGLWKMDSETMQAVIFAPVYCILSVIFLNQALTIVQKRINLSLNESKKNLDRYRKIEVIVGTSKKGIDIGSKLTSSTEKAKRESNEINENLSVIKTEIAELDSRIDHFTKTNQEIIGSTNDVNDNIANFSSIVASSSSAVEEMTTSITNITRIIQEKNGLINNLSAESDKGEIEMNAVVEAIKNVSRQSSGIIEIIDVIVNIASQTDLLAMNAAIEAAHAGDFGKGFAVVADEIRSLAEKTNDNIKIITGTLQKTNNDITTAAQINLNAARSFHNINEQIKLISNSMIEISTGMTELSEATKHITAEVSRVVTMSDSIKSSINSAQNRIASTNDTILFIAGMSKDISQKTNDILNRFGNIQNEIKIINEVGIENKAHIQAIDEELLKVNE